MTMIKSSAMDFGKVLMHLICSAGNINVAALSFALHLIYRRRAIYDAGYLNTMLMLGITQPIR